MAQERSELEKLPADDEFEAMTTESMVISEDEDRPEEVEVIREQIVETRKEMGETIDAIQDKLSFSNLSDQVSEKVGEAVGAAKDAAYEATIGKAATFMKNTGYELSKTDIFKTVQRNPLPIALIGIGAGILVYQNVTDSKAKNRSHSTGGREYDADRSIDQADGSGGRSSGSGAGAKLSAAGDTVSKSVGSAFESVAEKAGNASSAVGDAARQAYGKVGEAGSAARDQYDHQIQENPLAVGAVALALGAAVGFAIPSTRYESELMGETRQNLLDKAQTGASDLIDKTKELAHEAGRVVTEKAKAAVADNG